MPYKMATRILMNYCTEGDKNWRIYKIKTFKYRKVKLIVQKFMSEKHECWEK